MNENGGKSSTILLTVIGIATLLVVVVGATFAYFAAQITGNEASSVTITAASDGTSVAIGGTEAVTLTGIYPRSEAWVEKDVTLNVPAVEGSKAVAGYSFDLVVSSNSYKSTKSGQPGEVYDLSYTFINDKKIGSIDTTDTKQNAKIKEAGTYANIGSGKIARNAAADISFKLRVYFDMEDDANQNPGTGEKSALFNVVMNWIDDVNAQQ